MTEPGSVLRRDVVEAAARALETHPDYRVVRRLDPLPRGGRRGAREGMLAGCALDVETTGLDHNRHRVIELALRGFWADAEGRIVVVGRPHAWLEDPGAPLTETIERLTGIRSAEVAGRSIFEPDAVSLLRSADFLVSHNAAFDRPFVEARLPAVADGRWVCSMNDVDWRGLGFEGRSLHHLLLQMGWFYDAHRAGGDVEALLRLLDHRLPDGGTVLAQAIARATRPSWRVETPAAPFAARTALKERGYRWDPERRSWWREVGAEDIDEEIGWATGEVYGGLRRPLFSEVGWAARYAARVRPLD